MDAEQRRQVFDAVVRDLAAFLSRLRAEGLTGRPAANRGNVLMARLVTGNGEIIPDALAAALRSEDPDDHEAVRALGAWLQAEGRTCPPEVAALLLRPVIRGRGRPKALPLDTHRIFLAGMVQHGIDRGLTAWRNSATAAKLSSMDAVVAAAQRSGIRITYDEVREAWRGRSTGR